MKVFQLLEGKKVWTETRLRGAEENLGEGDTFKETQPWKVSLRFPKLLILSDAFVSLSSLLLYTILSQKIIQVLLQKLRLQGLAQHLLPNAAQAMPEEFTIGLRGVTVPQWPT